MFAVVIEVLPRGGNTSTDGQEGDVSRQWMGFCGYPSPLTARKAERGTAATEGTRTLPAPENNDPQQAHTKQPEHSRQPKLNQAEHGKEH